MNTLTQNQMSNTENYTTETWTSDILAAKTAHIDAFVLNTGYGMQYTNTSLSDAFAVAKDLDFKLFFSFDYTATTYGTHGVGRWSANNITELLDEYIVHPAYFRTPYKGSSRPLVSTFEGFEAASDWAGIKKNVSEDIVFVPDWASVGPVRASNVTSMDGLMSWNAWPDGTNAMNTSDDEAYRVIIDSRGEDKLYIMPISPWLYTNLPQFNKNWVWRGDDLWYVRWQQVLTLDPPPDFVEIISWNDYGESHYIGPLHEDEVGTEILSDAGAPFDYANGMPHDGWRVLLPYLIEQYKVESKEERDNVEIKEELLSVWYRLSPAWACEDGNTTGNAEAHDQTIFEPVEILEDKIFYSALLEESANVDVFIGGGNGTARWTDTPQGGRGIYHGSVDMGDREGEVVVMLSRNGETFNEMRGKGIELQKNCPLNQTNWNAWVGVGNATSRALESWGSRPVLPGLGWMAILIVVGFFTCF
ncbi:glycoside hydrolase [Aspergillus multicolor]|uniref:glycoside hydrolase family 71 protein n=1 Tax=Aspergillus multicolor TaxID=41759 RepID=UPI003CCDE1BF